MANLNKVMLIGRLTRDPESKTTGGGTKVVTFGTAVNNRRKERDGSYQDVPMFIEAVAFNKTGEVIEQYCRKGSQVYLEGRLDLEQWDDKNTGQKRSKHKVVVDNVQLLDSKRDGPQAQDNSPTAGDDNGGDIPF